MADMSSMPFAFEETPQQVQPQGDLAGQWGQFLSDPRGRAALLSFGAQMMQPMGFGQTGAGHFGASLGAAGEGARNQEALELKEREASSKEDLRAAQADSAVSRANAAEARANAAGANSANMATRLEIARLGEEGRDQRARSMNQIRVSNMYQQYVKNVNENNRRAQLTGGTQTPVLPLDQWISDKPHLAGMISTGREGVLPGATPTSGGDPAYTTQPPRTGAGAGDPGPMPVAPRNPADRVKNTVYDIPGRGPMRWTGTGWLPPQ